MLFQHCEVCRGARVRIEFDWRRETLKMVETLTTSSNLAVKYCNPTAKVH